MHVMDFLRPPSVAVVDVQGMIGPSVKPLEFARLLTRVRDDSSARAVVLNIDSPGGSASGSELITRAVLRLREEKPVVAFVGGMGASGGYMIASAAQHVIALPTAIVGAIGVISYRPLVYDALSRIGVEMRVSKSGRLKDMLSPFREPTTEEQQIEQRLLDTLYDQFVSGVADSRRMSIERVRELATGEVFAGLDAAELGLVDATGDLEDAIDWAVDRSGAPRRTRIVRPRRTLRSMLFGRASIGLAGMLAEEFDGAFASGGYALYRGRRP